MSFSNQKPIIYFQDFSYLFSSPKTGDVFDVNSHTSLFHFLDLLTIFQGMNLKKRALIVHVEYDAEGWANAFNFSALYLKTLKSLAQSYYRLKFSENQKCFFLISECIDKLFSWSLLDHVDFVSISRKVELGRPNMDRTGFHYVGIGDLKFRVPDKKVGFHFISLHHPLHWFLSFLISQAPKILKNLDEDLERFESQLFGNYSMNMSPVLKEGLDCFTSEEMSEALSRLDREFLIFDYPLHSIVFVAQVRAGLWVRNGESARMEATHMKEAALRDAYDANVFLMQYASIKFESDLFLTNVLDRFGVIEFIESSQTNAYSFDQNQNLILVEDILSFLLVLLTERSYLCAHSQTQILRKEILHQLAVRPNGMAYSTLSKLLTSFDTTSTSEDPDYESFDNILYSLTNFKYPDGIVDSGVYTLKEEFYPEVDSWFHHYNKNQRQEMEEILKSKFKNSTSIPIEQLLNLPKIEQIKGSFGFNCIGDLIHGNVFGLMLLKTMWKITKPVFENGKILSDGVFVHMMQMILVSVEIMKTENEAKAYSFSRNVELLKINVTLNGNTRETSLLDIILALIDRANHDDIKEHRSRLRYIVRQLESAPENEKIIKGWRDKSNWNFFDQTIKVEDDHMDGGNEQKKRKLAAKARQAAIMAQFSQAQNSFMANYGDEIDDMEMDVDEEEVLQEKFEEFPEVKKGEFCHGVCIVCTEETSSSMKSYGLLCLLQETSIRRQVDFLDHKSLLQIKETPLALDSLVDRKVLPNVTQETISKVIDDSHFFVDKTESDRNGSRITKSGITTTTCGHLMHTQCFESYLQSVRTRQSSQMFRNHPESLENNEFLCPLCKGLGNTIIPVVWDYKEEKVNWRGSVPNNPPSFQEYIRKDIDTLLHRMILERQEFEQSDTFSTQILISKSEQNLSKTKILIIDSMATLIQKHIPDIDAKIRVIERESSTYEKFMFDNLAKMQGQEPMLLTQPELNLTGVLQIWDMFVTTISSIEILTRGSESLHPDYDIGMTLKVGILDRINVPTLQLLKVLSETCLSALVLKMGKTTHSLTLFVIEYLKSIIPAESRKTGPSINSPLLLRDGVSHLVYVSMTIIPLSENGIDHIFFWSKLFGLFEVIRAIISIIEAFYLHGKEWLNFMDLKEEVSSSNETIDSLVGLVLGSLDLDMQKFKVDPKIIVRLCKYSLLTYSRRVTILLYARFGQTPPTGNMGFGDPRQGQLDTKTESELNRLLEYVGIGSLQFLINESNDQFFQTIIKHWCVNLKDTNTSYWSQLDHLPSSRENLKSQQVITIDQPNLYELVKLPRKLEGLFEYSLVSKCSKCNQGICF
jgi:hypothetical protein